MAPKTTSNRIPPGPTSWSPFGHGRALRRDPLKFLQELNRDYGDVAQYRFGWRHIVQVNHPDLIKDILVTSADKFRKTGLMKQAKPVLGNGLFLSEGEEHLRNRRLIQPVFARQKIDDYVPRVVEAAEEMAERWSPGERIDIVNEMLELALTIVARALFNVEIESDAVRLRSDLTSVIHHFDRLLRPSMGVLGKIPTSRNRRFWTALRRLDSIVYGMIRAVRGNAAGHGDVIATLLRGQQDLASSAPLTDRQIRDEVMTTFVAGHETVATALTWTWFLLSQHPDVLQRLHDEWEIVLNGRAPTAADFPRLKYTEMVVAESMRVYPPVWAMSRRLVEEHEIGGYRVSPGTIVGVSQWVTHHDPRFYSQPHRFNPSRWTPDERAKRPKYAYFPFGGGPRLCIGEPFAWMEIILVLATIGQRWVLSHDGTLPIRLSPRITLRPTHGMSMVVLPSSSPTARGVARSIVGAL